MKLKIINIRLLLVFCIHYLNIAEIYIQSFSVVKFQKKQIIEVLPINRQIDYANYNNPLENSKVSYDIDSNQIYYISLSKQNNQEYIGHPNNNIRDYRGMPYNNNINIKQTNNFLSNNNSTLFDEHYENQDKKNNNVPDGSYHESNCQEYNNITHNCSKCLDGYFLKYYKDKQNIERLSCVTICDKDQAANLISQKCEKYDYKQYQLDDKNNKIKLNEKIVYSYFYTMNTCENYCGGEFQECSCDKDCVQKGNCCRDYKDHCEEFFYYFKYNEKLKKRQNKEVTSISSSKQPSLSKCQFEIELKNKEVQCVKCKEGFYYYNNECYKKCPNDSHLNKINSLCIDSNIKQNCSSNEFYLEEDNDCYSECPKGYKADKINKICSYTLKFTFHWVFPSKGSCNNKCGVKYNLDCSCEAECFRYGNCCEDFEKQCPLETLYENCDKMCEECSKNGKCVNCIEGAIFNKRDECSCKKGFKFNPRTNSCLLKQKESSNKKNSTLNNFTNEMTDEIKNNTKSPLNNHNTSNTTDTKNVNFETQKIESLINDLKYIKTKYANQTNGNPENNILNNNITINIVAFNKEPKIITENKNYINSNNLINRISKTP